MCACVCGGCSSADLRVCAGFKDHIYMWVSVCVWPPESRCMC